MTGPGAGLVRTEPPFTGTISCQYGTDAPIETTWSATTAVPALRAGVLVGSVCTVVEDDPGEGGQPVTGDSSYVWEDPIVSAPVTVTPPDDADPADRRHEPHRSAVRHVQRDQDRDRRHRWDRRSARAVRDGLPVRPRDGGRHLRHARGPTRCHPLRRIGTGDPHRLALHARRARRRPARSPGRRVVVVRSHVRRRRDTGRVRRSHADVRHPDAAGGPSGAERRDRRHQPRRAHVRSVQHRQVERSGAGLGPPARQRDHVLADGLVDGHRPRPRHRAHRRPGRRAARGVDRGRLDRQRRPERLLRSTRPPGNSCGPWVPCRPEPPSS